MELNQQSIDAYTKILKDPKAQGIPIRPLHGCFELTDVATPKDKLFNDYLAEVGDNLPKVFFYLIMDAEYERTIAKAPNGDLGYKLKYVPSIS